MSDILKDHNLYYFLINESFKKNRYASQVIVGDLNEQKLSEINGYILGHGNDDKYLYLITHDFNKTESWTLQKFGISESKELNKVAENKIVFKTNRLPAFKFIIHGDYIYVYTKVNQNNSDQMIGNSDYYMYKFSKDTLELVSEILLFKNDDKKDDYILISDKAVFIIENNIYIATKGGKVYRFNTLSYEFKEEFSLKDYTFTAKRNIKTHFNEKTNDISFIYNIDDKQKKYRIVVYDLEGNIKERLDFNKPKEIEGLVHSFIRIK